MRTTAAPSETSSSVPPARSRSPLASARVRRVLLLALLVLAVGLRVLFVLDMRANPTFEQPILDSLYHVEWARAIANGEDYYALKHGHPGPYFRAPLYIWLLGLLFRVFGDGLLLPRLVQCAFGAATTGLAYLVGKRAFDARTGLLAAAMAATYWVLIYFDGELLIETLIVPLDLLALWLTMRAGERATPMRVGLAGLVWGVSAIARPNVLLFAPCVVLWLAWLVWPRWRPALASAAVFTLAFFAPILPVTAINYFHGGDRVLVASQGGINFWIGNNPQSDGSTAIVPGTRGSWWEGYFDSIAQAERAEGRELRPSEVSQHYARKAWAFVFGEPAKSIPLLLRKLRIFWIDYELGNNEDVRFVAHYFSWIPRWMPLRFAVLGPLGLLGLLLVIAGPDRRRLFPVWGFVLVYTASVVAFFVCSRFRAPVLPLLMVLAGHAAFWLLDALRARRWQRLGLAAVVLVPASLLVNVLPSNLRRDDSNGLMQLGVAEWNRGHHNLAIDLLDESVRIKDQNSFAHTYLGIFLHQLERSPEAIPHLHKALLSDPRNVDALEALLGVYLDLERYDELLLTVTDGRKNHPESEIPYFYYGRMRREQARRSMPIDQVAARQHLDQARQGFQAARERAPDSIRSAIWLGETLQASGDARAALPHLEAALQRVRDAGSLEPLLFATLVQCYAALGQTERACQLARAWAQRRPADPNAQRAVQQHCQ